MTLRFGIDLGGTKIEIVGLDGERECLRRRVTTPRGDYAATLAAVADLVRDAERELGRRGSVGLGIPGTVSPDHGRIKNANSTCLIGQDLQGDLERLLERPVRLANDADCFALSEACDGAGAGAYSVFGVIVLGGGLSNMPALYREVPPLLVRHVFSDRINTRLLPARHGDSSGVRGAAWLWPA
ncbi:ROK family protein [Azotobacter bryophylli]|uniref:ROK family protein n=1 Tax=Azotobacter bryophylli TaxID=1986537 RepID=A0ABV7AZG6_9GAMM